MANANLDFSGLSVTRTFTFPDATGTIALTTGSTSIITVGTITTGVWHGTKIGLLYGGTNADLSGTGGASNVLQQTSSGAAITVGQLALADLSDAATIALLADPAFTGVPTAPTASPGDNSTQVATTAYADAAVTAAIGPDDPGISIPTTGNTVSAGGPQLLALTGIRPAGTLLALTINLVDGITNSVARILCTQVITGLTITGNVDLDATRSLLAAPTTLTANQVLEYWWDESGSSPCWVRAV